MLPEAKLDVLLAHHASLESQLLGQVNSESYVRITRELAELNPLIDAVKAYRAANAEIAGIDALIAMGYRSLSLSATGHGPVKAMILDLDAKKAEAMMTPLLDAPSGSVSIRQKLTEFAEAEGLSL